MTSKGKSLDPSRKLEKRLKKTVRDYQFYLELSREQDQIDSSKDLLDLIYDSNQTPDKCQTRSQ
jgi:hypothetical protein